MWTRPMHCIIRGCVSVLQLPWLLGPFVQLRYSWAVGSRTDTRPPLRARPHPGSPKRRDEKRIPCRRLIREHSLSVHDLTLCSNSARLSVVTVLLKDSKQGWAMIRNWFSFQGKRQKKDHVTECCIFTETHKIVRNPQLLLFFSFGICFTMWSSFSAAADIQAAKYALSAQRPRGHGGQLLFGGGSGLRERFGVRGIPNNNGSPNRMAMTTRTRAWMRFSFVWRKVFFFFSILPENKTKKKSLIWTKANLTKIGLEKKRP